MGGLAAHLVVGVEQRLTEQRAHMTASQSIDHPATLAASLDQSGQAELREVLTGHRGPTPGERSQAPHVVLVVAQRPEDLDPSRIGQHGKGQHGDLHLLGSGRFRMASALRPVSRWAHVLHSIRKCDIFAASHMT